jgi:hypothetical protein
MKKLILFLSVTLVSFTLIWGQVGAILNIQEPQSFRSQALGGTVDDDLDLIYDPIELRFVPGVRLYTNLSNLITSNEYILDDYSENEFLAGISVENPFVKGLWNAVLVQYKNDRNPMLDPYDDLEYSKTINNNYDDSGGDGLIDRRTESINEEKDYILDKKTAFILNNSYVFGDLTFGLRYAMAKESGEGISAGYIFNNYYSLGTGGLGNLSIVYPGSPTFSNEYNSYLLGMNSFRTFHMDEKGEFLGTYETSYSSIAFSAMKPIYLSNDTLEIRGDIQYMPIKETESQNDDYSGFYQTFSLDIPGYQNTYQESDNLDYKSELDGSILTFNLGLKQVFKTAAERKDNGFWELNAGMMTGSGDYLANATNAFNSRSFFFDGADTLGSDDHQQINRSYVEKESGDVSISAYYASFRINLPLGDRVHVGAGISLVSWKATLDIKYSDLYNYQENYTLDDDSSDSYDYVITGTSQTLEDRTYEEYLYGVTIPVGIEYKFSNNKKWCLRFGSIFSYSKLTMNMRQQNTRSEPEFEVTQYGDGTVVVDDVDENQYTSLSAQIKTGISSTTFVYGLGFQPTDNLQIDLIGYLGEEYSEQIIDARFLRHLRLSFTLKF